MDSYDQRGKPPGLAGEPGPAAPAPGIAGLSLPYRVAAAVGLAAIGLLACVHVAMVFLFVAPPNTVTKDHGAIVGKWIYPEFEQNWKLFAPNPLQQNVSVQVRAEVQAPDGDLKTSGWIDLSAEDHEAIRGNPFPSHADQNELRRAWEFYRSAHDDKGRPSGLRGRLSETYVRRLAMDRLARHDLGGEVLRIQLRSATAAVGAPPWSAEKINTRTYHRTLPWWTVNASDLPAGAGDGRKEAGE